MLVKMKGYEDPVTSAMFYPYILYCSLKMDKLVYLKSDMLQDELWFDIFDSFDFLLIVFI